MKLRPRINDTAGLSLLSLAILLGHALQSATGDTHTFASLLTAFC